LYAGGSWAEHSDASHLQRLALEGDDQDCRADFGDCRPTGAERDPDDGKYAPKFVESLYGRC
jgi:hypothetical protein